MEHGHSYNNHGHESEYIKLGEDGLANDVGQLRDIVHDLVGVIDLLLNIPTMDLILSTDMYEHIELMAVSAHTVVCPAAAEALSDVLEGMVARGEITPIEDDEEDRATEPSLPIITPEDRATSDRILREVFGDK